MSKMSKKVDEQKKENELRRDETVTNFMDGDSYVLNPLDTLRMITASSIFGEPSYYRDSRSGSRYLLSAYVKDRAIFAPEFFGKKTEEVMEYAIDAALSHDFGATLDWAKELRTVYHVRINPQIIMVRAALHKGRKAYTEAHPGEFDRINQAVMQRADEPMTQMAYFLYLNKGKKNAMPSLLKRSWARKLSSLGAYQVSKYKNHEIGMVDAVRLTHAHSPVLDELMKTGKIELPEDKLTWEVLRSQGKRWCEIFDTVDMGHMALLRNLRGVFAVASGLAQVGVDKEFCDRYLAKLKAGVEKGKQYPFRYYAAYEAICPYPRRQFVPKILDALEDCVDLSLANCPRLKGRTMCLSDNSGSAWGAVPSEYGTVTVAEIDNLSSVITAALSEEGYVGRFGDKLITYPITKRTGILSQARLMTHHRSVDVGGATEGGIWEFFRDAINNREHWDNIFIYSDQQAGHGGLYGTEEHIEEYTGLGYATGWGNQHVNVFELVLEYRKKVNPKVNVFSVQTAGYDNSVLPEYAYRTAILYGWTGREVEFADCIIRQWDAIESRKQ